MDVAGSFVALAKKDSEGGRIAEGSNGRDLVGRELVLNLAFWKFTIVIRKARINTQVLLFGIKVLAYALYV